MIDNFLLCDLKLASFPRQTQCWSEHLLVSSDSLSDKPCQRFAVKTKEVIIMI